jgi:hypothetical protein
MTVQVPQLVQPPDIFTILIVEDHFDAIEDQIEDIELFLKGRNLNLSILKGLSKDEVKNHLSSDVVDIIATDMNIQPGFTGTDVINEAKASGHFTDILFYSANEIDYKKVLESTEFAYEIQFHKGIDIAGPLKKIIEKNIKRIEDVILLRGVFIAKVIDLELSLNQLFADYFKIPEGTLVEFHELILENRGTTLEGKIEVLRHMIKKAKLQGYTTFLDDISDLQKHRNYLAHCKRDPSNKNSLLSMGVSKSIGRTKVISLVKKSRKVSNKLEKLRADLQIDPRQSSEIIAT